MDRMLVSSVRGMGCTCASFGFRFLPFVSPSASAVVCACVVNDEMQQLAFTRSFRISFRQIQAFRPVFPGPLGCERSRRKERGGGGGGHAPTCCSPHVGGGGRTTTWILGTVHHRPMGSTEGREGRGRWIRPSSPSTPVPSSSVLALRFSFFFFFSFLLSFSCTGLVVRTCWDSIPVSPPSTSIEGGRTTSIEPSLSASPPTFDRSTPNGGRNGGGDTHSTNNRRSQRHTLCTIAEGETCADVVGSQERLKHGGKDTERNETKHTCVDPSNGSRRNSAKHSARRIQRSRHEAREPNEQNQHAPERSKTRT